VDVRQHLADLVAEDAGQGHAMAFDRRHLDAELSE
jgi:hypothetical protein